MMGMTGSRRRTRTTPAMTTTCPPLQGRGRGQSINEEGNRKGRGGQQQQNSKSSLPALTPSLPARLSTFTPARSPVSTPAHPHTIPPCSYTRRPADPPTSTATPAMPTPITSIDGRDSHLTTSVDDRGSHPQPCHDCDLLQPSSTHSRVLNTIPKPTSSILKPHSHSRLRTPVPDHTRSLLTQSGSTRSLVPISR